MKHKTRDAIKLRHIESQKSQGSSVPRINEASGVQRYIDIQRGRTFLAAFYRAFILPSLVHTKR